ncbi:MAG: rod shape-determining protein MreC [Sedimentisphaerales bacterium]|nr:rod shape-determining protein MreC [Sedimentisphaerales bacterium]
MANNVTRVSGRLLFICFMMTGLILFFTPSKITNKFQLGFVRVFHKPISIGRNLSLLIIRLITSEETLADDVVSREKYDKLHNHLANVTEWLKQERQKVEELTGLRDRPIWKGVDFVIADVIAASINEMHGELVINRGKKDELAENQFVLAHESIVGTLDKVGDRTAQVKLISDPTSRIAVKIADFTMDRIMHGEGNCSASVKLVPIKYNIKNGDIVYAQKRPGFLGSPVIVGTIAKCKSNDDNPLVWDITVQPACDIKNLSSVAVVVMNPDN